MTGGGKPETGGGKPETGGERTNILVETRHALSPWILAHSPVGSICSIFLSVSKRSAEQTLGVPRKKK